MAVTKGTLTTPEVWGGTSGNIQAVLLEFLVKGVHNALNNEVEALQRFQKMKVAWQGRTGIKSLKVGRNTGVEWLAEGAAFGSAGQQERAKLIFEAKYLYGHIELDGPALESAKGPEALIDLLADEMDGVVTDVSIEANKRLFASSTVVGFIHEAKAGATDWEVSGDMELINTLRDSVGDDLLHVDFIRMDTYAEVDAAARDITTEDQVGSTITLDVALDTTALPDGVGCAIVVAEGSLENADHPEGIFSNLGDPTHFTVDRTTATGQAALQSNVYTMATSGAHNRTTLGAKRMQHVMDETKIAGGVEPKEIWMHPTMRQEYIDLMNAGGGSAQVVVNARESAAKGDLGFTDISFNGKPFVTTQHCPKGLMIFMNPETWKLVELGPGKFADLDGNELSRVAGSDAWGAFYRWYYNVICIDPADNAILTGIDFVGATAV